MEMLFKQRKQQKKLNHEMFYKNFVSNTCLDVIKIICK